MSRFNQNNKQESERDKIARVIKERNNAAYGGMSGKLTNNSKFKPKATKSNNPLSLRELNGRTGELLLRACDGRIGVLYTMTT